MSGVRDGRPEYGEYASPEELREILGADHPLLQDATDALSPAPASAAAANGTAAGPATDATAGGAPTGASPQWTPSTPTTRGQQPGTIPGAPAAPVAKPRPRWDLPVTVGLLMFAVLNVISSLSSRDLYPQRFEQVFQIMGIGEFTATGAAAAAANWDAGLQLAILVITIAVVALVVRRLRLVFWIPLVGGALASIASAIVAILVMVQDPAYLQLLQS